MLNALSLALTGAALLGAVNARIGYTGGMPRMPEEPLVHQHGVQAAGASACYCYCLYPTTVACPIVAATFDQYIDHDKQELGTFKQRYWYNAEFYAGPGAPIVLTAPGEFAADGYEWYTTNYTLSGAFAQELKGAGVIMEHRFWGDSSPYDTMTTKNLQLLTLDQAIKDIVHFANTVDLPFTKNTTSPQKSPWVISGGSYPGALVAWINKLSPGTFWAYHSSSGVVEPLANYWQYFEPVEGRMASNCSKDAKAAIQRLDEIFYSRNQTGRNALKAKFGLGGLEDDDFGSALVAPLYNWQEMQLYTPKTDNLLYQFCDAIEGVGDFWPGATHIPGADGVGACKALSNMAKWFREKVVPGSCASSTYWAGDNTTLACYDSHNLTSPYYTDRSVRNSWNLQWSWMLCNEPFQQWQAQYPGDTGLISKTYTTQSLRDQCYRFFPDEDGFQFGLKRGRTTEAIVQLTDGWSHTNSTRLLYVNGEFDPWRQESVASTHRPGGPLQSTEQVPTFIVKDGSHCTDLVMQNGAVNPPLAKQQQEITKIIMKWVGEFYTEKGTKQPGF